MGERGWWSDLVKLIVRAEPGTELKCEKLGFLLGQGLKLGMGQKLGINFGLKLGLLYIDNVYVLTLLASFLETGADAGDISITRAESTWG